MNIFRYNKDKTSIGYISGDLFPGYCVPVTNRIFQIISEEVDAGNAQILPYEELITPITWDEIRAQRDALLKESDWTALTDVDPKPSAEAWVQYRQALRDLTLNYSSPEDVVWPTVPQ